VKESIESTGGVDVTRGVAQERIDSAGDVFEPVVLLKSAPPPQAVLSKPRVLLRSVSLPRAVLGVRQAISTFKLSNITW
jgi:hypothetical protein